MVHHALCRYQYAIYLEYIKDSIYLSIMNQVSLFYTLEKKNRLVIFLPPVPMGYQPL